MAKTNYMELGEKKHAERIDILYEDRSVLAIDKPPGWMLVPFSWQKTTRNLQAAITSSIAGGSFWARSRNLKFLRFIHRLDADTSGILLFAKSQGALDTFSELFEEREIEKVYLAVAAGIPKQPAWSCQLKLAQDPNQIGKMKVDAREGKDSETHFKLLESRGKISLIEARPVTGRTHQIRVHLAQSGHPILGDELYGKDLTGPDYQTSAFFPMGLRAAGLSYRDPFTKQKVRIESPREEFLDAFGFQGVSEKI